MRPITLALLLTATACHDCPTPDDGEPDDSSSSGSSSAGESESSTGNDDCAIALHVCWDSDVDFTECLDAFFTCDPAAEVYYEECAATVTACGLTCCPYPQGSSAADNHCGPDSEVYDEVEACRDACGLLANCLP